MRTRIVFSLINRGAILPFHHQRILAEFIENYLPHEFKHESFKNDYNFSGLKGQTNVLREGLSYTSTKVTLVFSTSNKTLLDSFLENIFRKPKLNIGDLELRPLNVLLEYAPLFEETMKYICISPIVLVKDGITDIDIKRFINPERIEFIQKIKSGTLARLNKAGIFPESKNGDFFFDLHPDHEYLQKLRAGEKKFSRIYSVSLDGDAMEVRGYTIPFVLHSTNEVHQFIFERGVGELTHLGYGMMDVVNSAVGTHTSFYTFAKDLVVVKEA